MHFLRQSKTVAFPEKEKNLKSEVLKNMEKEYTSEELTDLSPEEMKKLDSPAVPNNDEPTDEEAWTRRGVENSHEFLKTNVTEAINILLGKKTPK